jgi:dTDP-4-dehydrorhamnose reductase
MNAVERAQGRHALIVPFALISRYDTCMNHPILIIGDGYLGTRLQHHFGDRSIITIADFTQMEVIAEAIDAENPQIIINAAGYTLTNDAEKSENRKLAYDVNVKGPANLAYLAKQRGIRLVHLSTGMIFDGMGAEDKGFCEDDQPNPTSYYTWTKAWADALLTPFMDRDNILIVRLHLPLSAQPNPRNLLDKLRKFDSVADIQGSVTIVEDLLMSIEKLIEQKATGIYHVANPGTISLFEIAEKLQTHGLIPAEKELKKMNKEEFDAMIKKSGGAYQPNSYLNTDKLAQKGIQLTEIHQAVENCITEYAASLG